MKLLALTAAAFAFVASSTLADPIHGMWQTIGDDNGNYGHIEVKDCDGTICGFLRKSFDADGTVVKSEHTNKAIVWDMVNMGKGKYSGGKIWSPDRDKTYDSKLELNGDQLKVSGCVLFLCRDGGTWTRVK